MQAQAQTLAFMPSPKSSEPAKVRNESPVAVLRSPNAVTVPMFPTIPSSLEELKV